MSLLDEVIEAHGGLERFRAVRRFGAEVEIGGNLLMLRLLSPRTRTLTLELDPTRPWMRMSGSLHGVFDGDTVRELDAGGRVVAERSGCRARVSRRVRWDTLDSMYFLGYAIWNYALTPFLFARPGFRSRELPAVEEAGERRRRLLVEYPEGFPTHCREQTFYFDDTGLLRRLDYTAEIFGPWAHAAHFCDEPKAFDGFVIPTRRRAYPRRRDGSPIRALRGMQGRVKTLTAIE